jgi:hypothetical protein
MLQHLDLVFANKLTHYLPATNRSLLLLTLIIVTSHSKILVLQAVSRRHMFGANQTEFPHLMYWLLAAEAAEARDKAAEAEREVLCKQLLML